MQLSIIEPIKNKKSISINLLFKEAYEILGIKKTATASRLKDYFVIAEPFIFKDGKTMRYIELIREKTILTEDLGD